MAIEQIADFGDGMGIWEDTETGHRFNEDPATSGSLARYQAQQTLSSDQFAGMSDAEKQSTLQQAGKFGGDYVGLTGKKPDEIAAELTRESYLQYQQDFQPYSQQLRDIFTDDETRQKWMDERVGAAGEQVDQAFNRSQSTLQQGLKRTGQTLSKRQQSAIGTQFQQQQQLTKAGAETDAMTGFSDLERKVIGI